MAALTITEANVIPGSNAKIDYTTIAGATIAAGQVVYKDAAAAGKLKLANTATSAATSTAAGIALVGATLNQPCPIITEGDVAIGTGTNATVYVASDAAAGAVMPVSDTLGSGSYLSILGTVSANTLKLNINNTGVQVD